jgi:ubiquinone/menaquinone biosynthesis C-methylase UbiE
MTDFESRAKDWDKLQDRVERASATAKAIHRRVKLTADMSALEYGCGTGLLSFALQPTLGSIVLADNSPAMLEVLHEKISAAGVTNMEPLQLDLSTDPLPARTFDLIYTLLTLHHIPNIQTILEKFHALLKPGGILCIADLDKEDGTFHDGDFDGHHGFDRRELKADLCCLGFTNIVFETCYVIPKAGKDYPMFLAVAGRP